MFTKVIPSLEAEWLEADGLGGFASGTVSGFERAVITLLVNGLEAWVEVSGKTIPISSQRYGPDVLYPDDTNSLVSFLFDPWPIWTFHLQGDLYIEQELFAVHGSPTVARKAETNFA